MEAQTDATLGGWRAKAHEIIFESDTPAGKAFDVVLILMILLSIAIVMLESVAGIREEYGAALLAAEWVFTILFTIEYVLRILCVGRPARYIFSAFGMVDLLAIVPTYLSVFLPGAQAMIVIRTVRILRVFRVLKLAHYVRESEHLARALYASRRKIQVFLFAVFTLAVIFGALMYLVEGPEAGITSIPRGLYWAIVTMTTVGYGDITPQTDLGQLIASCMMILGYGIIAVPTGIVTAQLTHGMSEAAGVSGQSCPSCAAGAHKMDAVYCRVCGSKL